MTVKTPAKVGPRKEKFPWIGAAPDARWNRPVGKAVRFSAVITARGIDAYVRVPAATSATFGVRGHVPVVGTMNGTPIRVTLVPKGGGRHELFVNLTMLAAAKARRGQRATFVLRRDAGSRMPPMIPAFAAALRKNARATAEWKALTPSKKKEILRYLHFLKTPETLARNVKKVIARHLRPWGRKGRT